MTPHPLALGGQLMYAQIIYYRRTRRLDVPLINDIILLPDGTSPSAAGNWTKVSRSVGNDGPLFMWYRRGKAARDMTAQEKQDDVITELDILYGADRPWYGFEKIDPPATVEKGILVRETITYRKGVKRLSFPLQPLPYLC